MHFRFECHRRIRTYCSRGCRSRQSCGKDVVNQFGTRRAWSKGDDVALGALFRSGGTAAEMASALGRSRWEVRGRIKKLGMERSEEACSLAMAKGGKTNKGRPRPDFKSNRYVGSGPANPFYGRVHSEAVRKVIGERARAAGVFKRLNGDKEFQRKRYAGLYSHPNRPESILQAILDDLYLGVYVFRGDGSFLVDGLAPDFVDQAGRRVIELFGEQYHDPAVSSWVVADSATEVGRRKALGGSGYGLLVVWSQEVFLGGVEGRQTLIQKIREFHETSHWRD